MSDFLTGQFNLYLFVKMLRDYRNKEYIQNPSQFSDYF